MHERRGARPTEARIDLAALRANLAQARRLAHGRELIAVVKADAYGHGVVPVVRTLEAAGVGRFAVATVEEGVEVRETTAAADILVLGGVHGEADADAVAAFGLVPVLHHEGQRALVAKMAARNSICVDVQVEVDTEMRRLGVPEDEALALLARVEADPGLRLAGIFTHHARADEPDPAHRLDPLERFRALLLAARERGIVAPLVHVANSAALLAFHETVEALPEQNAVRPGLMLYGVAPATHLDLDLTPVMTLRTEIVAVRSVAAGTPVGYGGTHRPAGATRIATVPIGYADGVPWSLANRGCVLLHGQRVPIAGRVSMDLVTLDVGEVPAEVGSEVILFGVGQGTLLRAEEVALAAGTVPYEILVRIGRRVPRVYVGD